ncbi:P63C domain-containing protein [Mucilaginibacter sp.]|uniref:P63C domain-containing protein n=1 Tax=Mucilaginibacter sp. TaxID=1882438 RepID=UPI002632AA42|nr:P63C domain-containing protein [Mucilaginibacter sp.]MDB4925887.1 hypothetical protein [Mucilaginibacter sp.]
MNAAQQVISKFGGQTELSQLIGKGQSTIAHWAKTGIVPAKWRTILLQLASSKNIELIAADFEQELIVLTETYEENQLQKATHWGELMLGENSIPCYVLNDGQRIFSLSGVVSALTGGDGGQLASYINVRAIRGYLPEELIPAENGSIPALINFDTLGQGVGKTAIGVPVEKFMDICIAFSTALQDSTDASIKLTERQKEIAIKANSFLRATAKVGIIALVDEATGYQYDRPMDALQFKLKLFLQEEMRVWEKTFPDELWIQFSRLTNWNGSIHSRPKYWGKLINELVYGYLDKDVYGWLKTNAPKPVGNLSYHRWLTEQYGLKKLMEHIWQLVGMASACVTMEQLRRKMAEKYGKVGVQITLFIDP